MIRPLVCSLLMFHLSLGQSPQRDTLVAAETELEDLLENVATENGESQDADVLEDLRDNPLDLNRASEAELARIPGVSPLLVRRIVARRTKQKFISVDQILEMEGMKEGMFELLRRYVAVGTDGWSQGFDWPNVRIRSRLQADSPAADVRSALGSPLKVYNRVLIDTRQSPENGMRFEGGLVTEKDPGERYSEVFAAGYLQLTVPSVDGSILIGDFIIQSGRGLAFWRSSGVTKGGDVLGVGKARDTSIEPYRSTEENHFFRGVAVRKNLGWMSFKAFFSSRMLNGSRNEEGIVTSLDSDGLFRTQSELSTRHAVRETIAGGIASVEAFEGFLATVKASKLTLSRPVALSRYSDFSGREADLVAADIVWKWRALVFSGEAARDRKGAIAASVGFYLEPARAFKMVLAARMYPRSFNSLHGFGMSEGGVIEGERGTYVGATIQPSSWLNITSFYDAYVFSNRFSFQSSGNDFLARARFRFGRRWEMTIQYRKQNKPMMAKAGESGLDQMRLERTVQDRYRWTLLFVGSDIVRWQTRIEAATRVSRVRSDEEGFMVLQDMRWQMSVALRVSLRLAVFDTETYDVRINTFEQDVPGGFPNVPLWGSGIRTYFLAEYFPAKGNRISAKYSRLIRDATEGGQETELLKERITVQWDMSF